MSIPAQCGLVWLVTGAIVFAINVYRGKGLPKLAEENATH